MHTFPLHAIAVVKRRRHGASRGGSQVGSTPTTVQVTPATFIVDPTGKMQLAATVLDQFGAPMPGQSVSWTSSAPAVATVDSTGLVTGVAVGTATITATDGTISGTASCTVSTGTQWHVTTSGLSTNAGTSVSPWDIVTGLNGGPTGVQVQPGDTVLIHAGSYGTGIETWNLNAVGSASRPVIFKPNPGDMFAIDIKQLNVAGHDIWLYNDDHFRAELYCSVASPDGTDLTRFQDAGTLKVINWVVHDGGGIGLAPQSETADHEMNGNILYNNGRSATLAPVYGHGIYSHGTTTAGQKRKIRGNILFNQVGYGIHSFADTGNEDNFEVYWNFSFGNGLGNGYDMLIGGQTALTNPDVQHNATKNLAGQQTATVGYLADGDPGAVGVGGLCQYNYFSGLVALGNWDNAGFSFLHNIVCNGDGGLLVRWKFTSTAIAFTGNTTDYNTYASTEPSGYGFAAYGGVAQNVIGTYASLANLRTALGAGQETHSTLDTTKNDVGTVIRMYNSEYVAGRSHLFIDNPSGTSTVAVDISPMVASGQTYEIWNVYDLLTQTNPSATAVLSGTYAGGTVNVPMTGKTPKAVVGGGFTPRNGSPNTAAFVVLQTSVGGTPAITPSPISLSFAATVGGASPAAQAVALSSSPAAMGLSASVSYTSGSGWLAVSLDQNRTNATLTATATLGALAAGTYSATITLHSSNAADKTIAVTFTVSATGSDPAGLDTLQTALGGAAHVLAAYDRRQNWSATSVTDTRFSGGTGPALTKDGAPTLDGSGNLVFASGDDFHSAASALFKLSAAGSLLLVASVAANTNPAGISPSATPTVYAQVSAGATDIGMWTDAQTNTTVAVGATLRPIILTWDGLKTATIQVANQAAASHVAAANFDAGNCALTLGGWFDANGANGGVTIAACLMVDHVVNSTEVSAFVTYATGQLGATAA